MLRQSYGHHYETDQGQLIPAPGFAHPALSWCAHNVRRLGETEVMVPVIGKADLHPSSPSPSTPDEFVILQFSRNVVVAEDNSGRRWYWYVWLDQYGRGIAGHRARVPAK